MGFSLINHPFWVPPFMETPIYILYIYTTFFNTYLPTTSREPSRATWQRDRAAAAATAVWQTRPDFGIPGETETSTAVCWADR